MKSEQVIQNAIKDSQEKLNREIEEWCEARNITPEEIKKLKEIIDPGLVIL